MPVSIRQERPYAGQGRSEDLHDEVIQVAGPGTDMPCRDVREDGPLGIGCLAAHLAVIAASAVGLTCFFNVKIFHFFLLSYDGV